MEMDEEMDEEMRKAIEMSRVQQLLDDEARLPLSHYETLLPPTLPPPRRPP